MNWFKVIRKRMSEMQCSPSAILCGAFVWWCWDEAKWTLHMLQCSESHRSTFIHSGFVCKVMLYNSAYAAATNTQALQNSIKWRQPRYILVTHRLNSIPEYFSLSFSVSLSLVRIQKPSPNKYIYVYSMVCCVYINGFNIQT